MNKTLALATCILLTACEGEVPNQELTKNYEDHYGFGLTCIDGIEYIKGYKRLAVHIDKETLLPTRCERRPADD